MCQPFVDRIEIADVVLGERERNRDGPYRAAVTRCLRTSRSALEPVSQMCDGRVHDKLLADPLSRALFHQVPPETRRHACGDLPERCSVRLRVKSFLSSVAMGVKLAP